MKKKSLIIFFFTFFLTFALMTSLVFAQNDSAPTSTSPLKSNLYNAIKKSADSYLSYSRINRTDYKDVIVVAINLVLVSVGAIFIVYTIYGGYLWITAVGNDSQVTKAKDVLRNGITGMIIVFSGYTISYYVTKAAAYLFIEKYRGNENPNITNDIINE